MLYAIPPGLLLTCLSLALAKQPSAPAPVAGPLRELPWGQLNFLHTTDTHGWHAGHLQEAQYSADWGDYISFAHHLRKRADSDGSDLLIVDSGDRVEGNGLYDASDPKGLFTSDIIKGQSIDVLVSGNHELYKRNTSQREFDVTVPNFKSSYIASNIDICNPKTGDREPLATRFRKFTTKNQGIRIMAFGFLFDFHGNDNNTVVQDVKDTLKETWFQDAIGEKDVDLYLIVAHAPVRDGEELEQIYKAIREAQWDTPIVFFGGHTHIRDYRKFEKNAWALESGRYMETLGFLSITGLSTGKKDESVSASLNYQRLYVDNNLYSLYHHTATNKTTFDTDLGRNVSKQIRTARKKLDLDKAFGCAPHDYWLSRAPYPSENSLITLLEKDILPATFNESKSPAIVVTNTGALRFDIFQGPFTIDSTFLVSPFTSGFKKLKDVPYGAASQVVKLLNNEGQIWLKDLKAFAAQSVSEPSLSLDRLQPPHQPQRSHNEGNLLSRSYQGTQQQVLASSGNDYRAQPRTPGYTTKDDAGTEGDDTIHDAIQFYQTPNVVGSNIGFSVIEGEGDLETPPAKPDKVDVVYNEFVEGWVILALEYLGVKYQKEDAEPALGGKPMTNIISDWIGTNWKCPK